MTTETSGTSSVSSIRSGMVPYVGLLFVLVSFADPGGGMVSTPISFFLKNRMQLSAHDVATFQMVAAVPFYISGLFGFVRDRWNPFGLRDRGFLLLFGGGTALLYGGFAYVPISYAALLGASIALSCTTLLLWSALNGLMATVGQQQRMSGAMGAAWSTFSALVAVSTLLLGGWLSDWMETLTPETGLRTLFLLSAGVMLLVGLIGVIGAVRPACIHREVQAEFSSAPRVLEEIKRLFSHPPVYPALLIWALWSFSPGTDTPLLYYFQNVLHGSDAEFGQFSAVWSASFIPTYLLFGWLSRRLPLRTLLLWGSVAALPEMLPMTLIGSVPVSYAAALLMGQFGGVASAAYTTLLIRSCPTALQGTTLMLSVALGAACASVGNIVGTYLYDHDGGFTTCVAAMVASQVLLLLCLRLVPAHLVADADKPARKARETSGTQSCAWTRVRSTETPTVSNAHTSGRSKL